MEEISKTKHYQNWATKLTSAGHVIENIQCEHVVTVGEKKFPLFILLKPAIRVDGENRIKSNEIVIIRPSTYHTIVWSKNNEDSLKDRVLLIKEFRSTVINHKGFVFELPAGSAKNDFASERSTAVDELKEETGLTIDPNQLIFCGHAQQAPTVVAHLSSLYSVRITEEEMNKIIVQTAGKTFGDTSETEITHVCVVTVGDIMNPTNDQYGWELRGMVAMRV